MHEEQQDCSWQSEMGENNMGSWESEDKTRRRKALMFVVCL